MVNLFYKKMDGPLDGRRGFAIQSLKLADGRSPRQPTHDAANGNQPARPGRARLPPHTRNGARRHVSSFAPTGGAAQRVVPQRARGCAAVLSFLAVRSCNALTSPSLAAGRRPFFNSPCITGPFFNGPFNNSLARLRRSPPPCPCPCVAAVPARVAPCASKAMARDVRNQPAIATRFLA
jgi:hypothetical protein